MEQRTNAGYVITSSITVGQKEIVLGEKKGVSTPSQYVTWSCVNGDSYNHGHYFASELSAKKDFCDRTMSEIEFLEQFKKKREPER